MGGWATRDDAATMCQRPRDRPPSTCVTPHIHKCLLIWSCVVRHLSAGRSIKRRQEHLFEKGHAITPESGGRDTEGREKELEKKTQTRRLEVRWPCARAQESFWHRLRRDGGIAMLKTLFESTDAEGALTLLGRFLNYVSRTFVL